MTMEGSNNLCAWLHCIERQMEGTTEWMSDVSADGSTPPQSWVYTNISFYKREFFVLSHLLLKRGRIRLSSRIISQFTRRSIQWAIKVEKPRKSNRIGDFDLIFNRRDAVFILTYDSRLTGIFQLYYDIITISLHPFSGKSSSHNFLVTFPRF